ncbi:MAG: dihydroorotase [Christensenellales bacterium]|jgi:dihydroorotase
MRLAIINGEVINPAGESGRLDIYIEDGKVIDMGQALGDSGADKVIDAKGLCIFPGFIDMHSHLREPGYEYKEDIKSGSNAAAKGGFTAVACMADTKPVADCAAVITAVRTIAKKDAAVRIYPVGAVTKALEGSELAEMGGMLKAGAVAFSDAQKSVMNAGLLRMAMLYAKSFGALIISKCEDEKLALGGVMNEGAVADALGLLGIPKSAEESHIMRDILIARDTGARLHITQVSTRGGIDIIRWAKKQGIEVSCDTAPHYFSGTEEMCEGYDANAKVSPALRTNDDVEAIIEAICDGTIDAVSSGHAPHHPDEKNVEFAAAEFGISSLESAVSLAVTNLVKPGVCGGEALARLMSVNPAKLLGVKGGVIKKGEAADITIVNMAEEYELTQEDWVSKGKNTPFFGRRPLGRVTHTLVEGRSAYEYAREEPKK